MSVGRVGDYIKGAKQAQSVAVFERVSDALHIPGEMLGISRREWEQGDSPGSEPGEDSPAEPKRDRIRTTSEMLTDDDLGFLIPGTRESEKSPGDLIRA